MQLNKYKQLILKEGYTKISIAIIVSIGLLFLGFIFFAKIGFVVTLALLWIYRNNLSLEYNPLNLDNTIYAPIDGKITGIDFVNEVCRIYIDVSLLDNHILRSPIKGEVKTISFTNGLNLSSWTHKSKFLNHKVILSFVDEFNETTKLTAISGIFGAKIVIYPSASKVLTRDTLGIFIQGTIVLEIPSTYELKVKIGEKISSGTSVIAGKIESTIE